MRPYLLALTLVLGATCALSGCGHHAGHKTQQAEPGAQQLLWALRSVSGSTLVIDVLGDNPGCDDGPHLHLGQSAQQVSVVFTTHSTLSPGVACAGGGALPPPQMVHLKKPLGSRVLVGCHRGHINCRHIGTAAG